MINKFPTREEGQGLVEYALILVLVAIVVIAILLQLGPELRLAFGKITAVLQGSGVITSSGTIDDIDANFSSVFGSPNGNLTVTVTVSQNTTVTVTGDGGISDSQSCSGTCTFTFNNVPNSGFVTATDSAGGEGVTAVW